MPRPDQQKDALRALSVEPPRRAPAAQSVESGEAVTKKEIVLDKNDPGDTLVTVEIGDLVSYRSLPAGWLVGIVVGVNDIYDRAEVHWQGHATCKMVELKDLEVLGRTK